MGGREKIMTDEKLNDEILAENTEEQELAEGDRNLDPMEAYKSLPSWVGPPKRRKYTRRSANYVVLETTDRPENWVANCVSMGGMFCPDIERKKGTTLQLKILFPDGSPPIFATAKVVYCRRIAPRLGVGIEFTFPQARLGHQKFMKLSKTTRPPVN